MASGRTDAAGAEEYNNKLAKEFLRRSALWAQRLECISQWPFFDIAHEIDPELVLDADLETTLLAHLDRAGSVTPLTSRLLLWALRWAALEDARGTRQRPSLPHPFEPVVSLYERGGSIIQHHGMILTPVYGFRPEGIDYYQNREPYVENTDKPVQQS